MSVPITPDSPPDAPSAELAKLSQAERMLAEVASTDEALNVIDYAEAARVFAQRARLGTSAVNHATTVKLRAERRLADLVDEGQKAGAIATPQTSMRGHGASPEGGEAPKTLADIGVDSRRLAEARAIRDTMTDQQILDLAKTADEADKELSRKELVKAARRAKRIRAKREAVERIEEAEPTPLATLGPFAVLYADPPWRYEHSETTTREIENHYPTMSHAEICALDVPAADDAVLFLWVTSPKLVEGLGVMAAWGFEYRTSMVWVKDKIGMGYYARQQHELLLIGKRGTLPVPDPEDRPSSVIVAARGQHSAKPDEVYELIERMYPLREWCELFQRRPRARWAGWGNQA